MQWSSHFFEVVIVASCNEYLSLPKQKKKEEKKGFACPLSPWQACGDCLPWTDRLSVIQKKKHTKKRWPTLK